MARAKLMGARVRRKEDPRLLVGAATYVDDIKLPGMLHVAIARSPYAHARVLQINTAAALSQPGVVAVFTGADLTGLYTMMPMAMAGESAGDEDPSLVPEDHTHYPLSVGKVRHVGEAVAVIIAQTIAAAYDALATLEIEWEELPVVADLEQAIAPDAPRVFSDLPGNIEFGWKRKSGDPDTAFAEAEVVVCQRIRSQRLAPLSMEGRAVLAAPDPATGGLTVWTSTQAAHLIRKTMAQVLRMPESMLRVIAPEVGGGFGAKIGAYPEDLLLAALAHKLKLPLKWVETRSENFLSMTHGRAQFADMELAARRDGTVTALRMRVVADIGAYPMAPDIPALTGRMAVGVYAIPAVDIRIDSAYTNTTPVAAYRGAGRPEAAYYIERMMDVLADELGLDPAELRRKNFIAPDRFPYRTPAGLTYDSGEYERALEKALEHAGYAQLKAEQERLRAAKSTTQLGIGLACYVEICGFGPYESAGVRVEPSGTVSVTTGISPHGQGQHTTFAQIVADELGVPFDSIVVRHGDTAITPSGQGTMGSRGLAVGGGALMMAVGKVRDKMLRIAAYLLEAAPEDLVIQEGHVGVRGVPDQTISITKIAELAYSDKLPNGIDPGLESTDYFKPEATIFPFGAHVAVVEVDTETGQVKLRNYISVDDCGPRISPLLVEGQVHGGLAQGIAQALFEELVYDSNGQLLTGSLMDYAIPHADQLISFTTDQTETPTHVNPLGVKGIGEAATIGSTPAVANAVIDALTPFGVRHIDLPLRPEKVWRAVQHTS